MKCIHCSTDAKYSERSDGKCPKCHHPFAFEPKGGDAITDAAFNAAIERVSAGGTVKWTLRHLFYEVVRMHRKKASPLSWVIGILGVVFLIPLVARQSPLFLVPAVVIAIVAWRLRRTKLARLAPQDFDAMWKKWVKAHGSPRSLIVRRSLPPRASAKPKPLPSDIQHYSFDRAVVTDRPETVDLLLANNFHFENNCAVFTRDGYPQQAFETVRAMLQNNPKLEVYVLHDATVEGCVLASELRQIGWFQPTARIVDVGLRPSHAAAFEGCWMPSVPSDPARLRTLGADRAWLERFSLELAVIRPEQVIKRLFRAITTPSKPPADDESSVNADTVAFITYTDTSDGGGDSFG